MSPPPDLGYVCALEEIGLYGANDGFELTAVPIADGQPFAAGGLTQTTPACLERPACWAQQLRSHCLGDCSAAPRVGLPGPAPLAHLFDVSLPTPAQGWLVPRPAGVRKERASFHA